MPERVAPPTRWGLIAGLAALILVLGVGAWEWTMRAAGMHAGDLGDADAAWAQERRRVDAENPAVVIVGSSRLHFNVDLATWRAAAGVTPIQLARRGTTPVPMIHDIAANTEFRGLLVVGFDPLVFFSPPMRAAELVKYAHEEPLFKRTGLPIYHWLSEYFAFLDREFRPTEFLLRLDVPQRTPSHPANTPWKIYEVGEARQAWVWDRVEYDRRFRDEAAARWLRARGAPPKPEETEATLEAVAADVAKIRQRGGDVVFVRSPSDGPLLEREESLFPRARTWDRLLELSGAGGVHYADEPTLRDFHTIELSHLRRSDTAAFTRALVPLVERARSAP